jgi:Zn-finger nucleic acid-binding protein
MDIVYPGPYRAPIRTRESAGQEKERKRNDFGNRYMRGTTEPPGMTAMNGTGRKRVSTFNCPNCGAATSPDDTRCSYCGSAIAARICPSCFGAVAVGMKHCPICGAAVTESAPEIGSPLRCPCCKTTLAPVTVGKHSLQECLQCGGLWIDRDSFRNICTREEEQQAVLHIPFRGDERKITGARKRKRAYIPCPECGKLMNHKNFSRGSGIVLDWCREHGNWFDRQELQQVVDFIRQGGLQKARERELEDLQIQKEQLRVKELEITTRSNRLDSIQERESIESPILRFLSRTFLG